MSFRGIFPGLPLSSCRTKCTCMILLNWLHIFPGGCIETKFRDCPGKLKFEPYLKNVEPFLSLIMAQCEPKGNILSQSLKIIAIWLQCLAEEALSIDYNCLYLAAKFISIFFPDA